MLFLHDSEKLRLLVAADSPALQSVRERLKEAAKTCGLGRHYIPNIMSHKKDAEKIGIKLLLYPMSTTIERFFYTGINKERLLEFIGCLID